jgi:uncharacterized protein (TIGR00290 family)
LTRPKAFVSWSSGKDSAYALWEVRNRGLVEIVGVLTTISEAYDRVAMHGVRQCLLDRQIAALNLPAIKVLLPTPCSNEIYEARMAQACAQMKAQGADQIVFGDLFLEDIRAYRIEKLAGTGIEPIFPLWKRETTALAHKMISSGLAAYLTCVDPKKLDRSFVARRFDQSLLRDLPSNIDPCGENGEFHTVVTAGPMFTAPVPVRAGEIVERDGFVFADFIPI